MSQYGFLVDVNQCVGCRACEMACKTEYQVQAGQGRRRRVIEKTVVEGGSAGDVKAFFISLACNQCDSPACIAACPKSLASGSGTAADSALWKDDAAGTDSNGLGGVVHFETSHCIGCRRCEWACPYGQPQFDPDSGTIHKCELCYQRIGAWKTDHPGEDPNTTTDLGAIADKRRLPACAATCLGRALNYADLAGAAASVTVSGNSGAGAIKGTDYDDQHGLDFDMENTGTRSFDSAGTAGRGSAYLADTTLTGANVRVCNRVYKDRNGVAS